jgi:hypothetical protein
MLSQFLPRTPAFAGLRPDIPRFVPVDDPSARYLLAVMSAQQIRRMEGAPAVLPGYYLSESEKGRWLFLKVVDSSRVESQVCADGVAAWVESRGVGVSRLLPGYPRQLEGGYAVLAYSHIG